MSIEIFHLFISDYTLTSVVAILTFIVFLLIIVMLINRRRTEKLLQIKPFIVSMPFLAGLIPLTALFTDAYNLLLSFHRGPGVSGTSDPRVVAAGFHEFFTVLAVSGGLFFIFLEVWIVLRMIFERFQRELETLPK